MNGGTSLKPSRRKSGRATRQPEYLSPSQDIRAKRKHDSLSGASESGEEDEDGEPDEEELRERTRKAPKTTSKKPAARSKKANTLDGPMPVRPAPVRAKKAKRAGPMAMAGAQEIGGLYGELIQAAKCRCANDTRRFIWRWRNDRRSRSGVEQEIQRPPSRRAH